MFVFFLEIMCLCDVLKLLFVGVFVSSGMFFAFVVLSVCFVVCCLAFFC